LEKIIDVNQIKKMLPHRYPFLLVDRVLEFDEEKETIVALKNVTSNEPHFEGHFPIQPVMPGVLILEALAQSCGLLSALILKKSLGENGIYLLVGFDNARFKRPIVPGDQVLLKSTVLRRLKGIWKFSAEATVDGEQCCSVDIMCTYKDV